MRFAGTFRRAQPLKINCEEWTQIFFLCQYSFSVFQKGGIEFWYFIQICFNKIPLIPVGCYNLYTIYNIFWGNWGMEFHKKRSGRWDSETAKVVFWHMQSPKLAYSKGNWGIYFPPWPVAASADSAAMCIFTHVRNSHIIGDHGEWPSVALAWAAFHLEKKSFDLIDFTWFFHTFALVNRYQ